jgi:hypothetical protein
MGNAILACCVGESMPGEWPRLAAPACETDRGRVTSYTETDLDALSWHDCYVRGLALDVGDADEGETHLPRAAGE